MDASGLFIKISEPNKSNRSSFDSLRYSSVVQDDRV